MGPTSRFWIKKVEVTLVMPKLVVYAKLLWEKVNLWKAVKLAKNLNSESIPTSLTLGGGEPVAEGCVAESFGSYFSEKTKQKVSWTGVDINHVYNGKCKLLVQNSNFMTKK